MKTARQYFFRRYGLTALLGTFAVASLGVIGFETDWGYALRSAAKSAGAARKAEMVAMLPAFTLTPLETGYRESGERPLFLPTRRPVLATAVSQVVMKKGQYKLTGTSMAPDLSVAYLQEVSSGKTIRVTKGLEINGIKLDVVEASRVVLKQGDDSEELTLRTAASPPRPPTPATPVGTVVAGQSGALPAITGPAAAFMPGVASAAQTPVPASSAATTPPAVSQQMAISVLRSAAPVAAPIANEATTDPNPAAQRRRRFQNAPQQLPENKTEK